jgi:hypothetical protein
VSEEVKVSTVISAWGRANNDSPRQRGCQRNRGESEAMFARGGAGGAVIERNEDNGLFPSTFQATNPIFSSCQHLCIDRKEGEGPLL